MRELRHALGQMRLNELAVGPDGRNRVLLSAFGSKTGRNQPSNSSSSSARRAGCGRLIRPAPGRARGLRATGRAGTGDRGGAVRRPADAGGVHVRRPVPVVRQVGRLRPAERHEADPRRGARPVQGGDARRAVRAERDRLARKLGITPATGGNCCACTGETFRRFWAWSDAVQDEAMLTGDAADGVRLDGPRRAGHHADQPAELPDAGATGRR